MEKTKKFTELIVWQKAHQFVFDVYKETKNFPREEIFGLTSQVRRSAGSIPANIAEGYKKKSKADKLRFLNISESSLEETKYHLILSNDLGYCLSSELLQKADEVGILLNGYYRAIEKRL